MNNYNLWVIKLHEYIIYYKLYYLKDKIYRLKQIIKFYINILYYKGIQRYKILYI